MHNIKTSFAGAMPRGGFERRLTAARKKTGGKGGGPKGGETFQRGAGRLRGFSARRPARIQRGSASLYDAEPVYAPGSLARAISALIRCTTLVPVLNSRAALRMPLPLASAARIAASFVASILARPIGFPLLVPFSRALASPAYI